MTSTSREASPQALTPASGEALLRAGRGALKSTYRFFKQEVLYGTLLYPYGAFRHRALVSSTSRSQCHTYTCFYRSPGQIEALSGPVMSTLLAGRAPGTFQIHVFASSNGAEAYTLASALLDQFPSLDFQITGSDLHPAMVEYAQNAVYSADEVHYRALPGDFVERTFERVKASYVVKPEIRSRVTFEQANLLDGKTMQRFEPADIVFMQNVLCHLDEEPASKAFRSVTKLLKPRSALFIDGMSLDLREELTKEAHLKPLEFKVREIHEFARSHVGERWWRYYYGIEPYATWHRDRARRFSTIFLKDEKDAHRTPDARENVSDDQVVAILAAYFAQERGGIAPSPTAPLLSSGMLDSMDIVRLLNFIEDEFNAEIHADQVKKDTFDSLRGIAKLIGKVS